LEESNTLAYFVGASLEKIRSFMTFVPIEARAVSRIRFHTSMVAAYGVTVKLTIPEI
jgi:hypothetical protein